MPSGWVGVGLNSSICQHFCPQIELPCPPVLKIVNLVPYTYVPGTFQAATWDGHWSVFVCLCTGPSRGIPAALCLIQMQSLLVFTARCYGNSSSLHWCSRTNCSLGEPPQLRYPSLLLNITCGCGTSPIGVCASTTSFHVASLVYPLLQNFCSARLQVSLNDDCSEV